MAYRISKQARNDAYKKFVQVKEALEASSARALQARRLRTYEFVPLPNSATHIRLIELINPECSDGLEDVEIFCQLSIWLIDAAPPYHAVSYPWGDPLSQKHRAAINGRRSCPGGEIDLLSSKILNIRDNAFTMLRQLSELGQARYWWVDALCIDQASNIEKNAQVARMGDIFAKAEEVFVWLAHHDIEDNWRGRHNIEDARNAMLMIERLELNSPTSAETMALELETMAFEDIDSTPSNIKLSERQQEGILKHLERISDSTESLQRFLISLSTLSDLRYFGRLWVFQELVLARKATICCGGVVQPAEVVTYYIQLAARVKWMLQELDTTWWPQRMLKTLKATHWYINPAAVSLLGEHLASKKRHALGIQTYRFSHPSHCIPYATKLNCTNTRDAVYGMLALIDWNGGNPISPDYSISLFELAARFLGYGSRVSDARELVRHFSKQNSFNFASIFHSDFGSEIGHDITLRQKKHQSLHQTRVGLELPSEASRITGTFIGHMVMRASPDQREIEVIGEAHYFNKRQIGIEDDFNRRGIKIQAVRIASRSMVVIVREGSMKFGDWLVFEPEPEFPPHGLILRSTQSSCYAIVGRAYAQPLELRKFWKRRGSVNGWPTKSQKAWKQHRKDIVQGGQNFKVCFDPKDFVVFAAHSPETYPVSYQDWEADSSELKSAIGTGICGSAFSSYALMEDGDE